MKEDILIQAANLSKSFGFVVFEGLEFSLERGRALGIIGPNGSGKTTLLDIIAGLETQSGGELYKNCKIGYVMQRPGFFNRLSCLDNMRYICALNLLKKKEADRRVEDLAKLCGIDFLRKRAGKCSAGMRQRLNIALALLTDPDVLLLDEAASALDADSRAALRDIIKNFLSDGRRSIIMVSHDMEEITNFCDEVLDIEKFSRKIKA